MSDRRLAFVLLGVALGLPLALLTARLLPSKDGVIEMHAQVAESGGWTPESLNVETGQRVKLRLVSDDVVHGFAVGQSAAEPIDLEPGRPVETTLSFDRPGKYTFYCTRWCGPGHWRMRGTIDVTGGEGPEEPAAPPLYLRLGLDLDAPHPARPAPSLRPSAERGQHVLPGLPSDWDASLDLRTVSPAEVWLRLRQAPETAGRTDQELWDLTAYLWWSAGSAEALAEGQALFADNCAACHGEDGSGEGVMAGSLPAAPTHAMGEDGGHAGPADFTDAERMLGASSALLQGKILRGGMGTGMPYFGPILTEDQTWALVDYLWSLSMDYEEVR